MTELWQNVTSPMCLTNLHKCLETPDHLEQTTGKGLYYIQLTKILQTLEVRAEPERMKNPPVTLAFADHNYKYSQGLFERRVGTR